MKVPVRISYRNLSKSDAVDALVRASVARLERVSGEIIRCAVTVERRHRARRQGNLVHARVELTLPGGAVVIGRDPERDHAHEDAHVAVRDAFRAARRALEDLVHTRRGLVKAHAEPSRGRVTRLLPGEGPGFRYGFIETRDGRAIYFHERSVLDDAFDRLAPGTPVRFVEELGEAGPQASCVAIAHRRRPRADAAAAPTG